mmetsp:Transcript_57475/g.168283  ORF Transcript_57475/g.168283 Transcript_57475/m.168283 type:complete len:209 (-) Transcript_57475:1715-2341(-)
MIGLQHFCQDQKDVFVSMWVQTLQQPAVSLLRPMLRAHGLQSSLHCTLTGAFLHQLELLLNLRERLPELIVPLPLLRLVRLQVLKHQLTLGVEHLDKVPVHTKLLKPVNRREKLSSEYLPSLLRLQQLLSVVVLKQLLLLFEATCLLEVCLHCFVNKVFLHSLLHPLDLVMIMQFVSVTANSACVPVLLMKFKVSRPGRTCKICSRKG